jgi:hypothetical protein
MRLTKTLCLLTAATFVGLPLVMSAMSQPRTIVVPAGGDLQAAINRAVRGDTIVLQVGTYNTSTPDTGFLLPAKAGTFNGSNYITIQTANLNSLPSARVSPTDVTNMPTLVVTLRGTPVITVAGSGYRLIGLEITNNLSGNTGADITNGMVDIRGGSDLVFDRCVVHPKEHPTLATNWLTRGKFAFNVDGNRITVKNTYIYDFFGRDPADSQLTKGSGQQTEGFGVSPNVDTLQIDNNYIQAWYATMQTAGSDGTPSSVQHLLPSPAPTLRSFRLNSVSGLTPGMIIAVEFANIHDPAKCKVQGDNTCWANGRVATVNASTGDVTLTEDLMTSNMLGNRITVYTTPSVPGQAVWAGTQPTNISMTRNTLEIPLDFGNYHLATNGNTGKGVIEGKACLHCNFEGNIIQGFPSSFSLTTTNQNGGAPWQTTAFISIKNNWFKTYRSGVLLSLTDYSMIATQGHDIDVSNNVFNVGVGWAGDFVRIGGPSRNVTVTHNTVTGGFPSGQTQLAYSASDPANGTHSYYDTQPTGVVITDNLTDGGRDVAVCYLTSGGGAGTRFRNCFNNPVMTFNLFALTFAGSDPRFEFPNPSNKVVAGWAAVKFVDGAGCNNGILAGCKLAADSPGHNAASDGTDIGANIDWVIQAVGPAPLPTQTAIPVPPTNKPTPSGMPKATPGQRPRRVNSPAAVPTPIPSSSSL